MGSEENKSQGYVQLFRSLKRWEWFTDRNTLQVFIYCLLSANHKETRYKGTLIERGSFVTSHANIARDCKLSVNQVRTALNHLKNTEEITTIFNGKGLIISVENYDDYQSEVKQNTSKSRASNKHITTNNNDNNDNNENKYLCANKLHYDEVFLRFWNIYPKQRNKKECYKYYLENGLESVIDDIIEGLTYLNETEYKENPQFVPMPLKFLDDERWKNCKKLEKKKSVAGDY